jgi:hypothetical protein
MHKKSIEAAEALKDSEDNCSDREDEKRSETSDTNSTVVNNHRKSPTTIMSNSNNNTPMNAVAKSLKTTSNGSPSSSSTMSPPISLKSLTPKQESASKNVIVMTPNYHLGSPHESNSNNNPTQHTPPIAHHTHPAASVAAHHYPPAPDTDAEVFRWVNYNRDIPVSFIR